MNDENMHDTHDDKTRTFIYIVASSIGSRSSSSSRPSFGSNLNHEPDPHSYQSTASENNKQSTEKHTTTTRLEEHSKDHHEHPRVRSTTHFRDLQMHSMQR